MPSTVSLTADQESQRKLRTTRPAHGPDASSSEPAPTARTSNSPGRVPPTGTKTLGLPSESPDVTPASPVESVPEIPPCLIHGAKGNAAAPVRPCASGLLAGGTLAPKYTFRGLPCWAKYNKPGTILFLEIDHFIQLVGGRNLAFLTLRFPQPIRDKKEAMRRFKSYRTGVLDKHFGEWVCVWERHKTHGGWHCHLIIDLGVDVASGYDHDLVIIGLPEPNDKLRHFRAIIHESVVAYGFAKFLARDLEPLRHKKAVANYLAKKLSWAKRREAGKGERLVCYSRGFQRCLRPSARQMLCTPRNRAIRQLNEIVGRRLGCRNESALAVVMGKSWQWKVWQLHGEFRDLYRSDLLHRLDEFDLNGEPRGDNQVNHFLDMVAERYER